jgi:hypothetical protein
MIITSYLYFGAVDNRSISIVRIYGLGPIKLFK